MFFGRSEGNDQQKTLVHSTLTTGDKIPKKSIYGKQITSVIKDDHDDDDLNKSKKNEIKKYIIDIDKKQHIIKKLLTSKIDASQEKQLLNRIKEILQDPQCNKLKIAFIKQLDKKELLKLMEYVIDCIYSKEIVTLDSLHFIMDAVAYNVFNNPQDLQKAKDNGIYVDLSSDEKFDTTIHNYLEFSPENVLNILSFLKQNKYLTNFKYKSLEDKTLNEFLLKIRAENQEKKINILFEKNQHYLSSIIDIDNKKVYIFDSSYSKGSLGTYYVKILEEFFVQANYIKEGFELIINLNECVSDKKYQQNDGENCFIFAAYNLIIANQFITDDKDFIENRDYFKICTQSFNGISSYFNTSPEIAKKVLSKIPGGLLYQNDKSTNGIMHFNRLLFFYKLLFEYLKLNNELPKTYKEYKLIQNSNIKLLESCVNSFKTTNNSLYRAS